jgi:hypothetical protein
MSKMKSPTGQKVIVRVEKKTAQGRSRNTNLAATPNRGRKRRYRGQGS